jgi:hypothetical protein
VVLPAEDAHLRARVANFRRHHPDRPELAADDQRQLKANKMERYIRQLVDDFPPLTQEQRARLATLLAGGGDGDAGAS